MYKSQDPTVDRSASKRDQGFTIIEMMVSISIFSVFLVILMTAVIGIARGTIAVQNRSDATSDSLIVFQNFDRQVRYADAINFPGNGPSGARYLEFRTPATSTEDQVTTCTQWRWVPSTGSIESRQWKDVVGSTKPLYFTKLTDATSTGTADFPFKLIPASVSTRSQQLQLTLGAGGAGGTALVTTFVARNSSLASESNVANAAGQSASPVCSFTGSRP